MRTDVMPDMPAYPDRCIACSSCLAACPVVRANQNFPGPRLLGPVYERFRAGRTPETAEYEDPALTLCSYCKNCEIACPCGVPVSSLIMRANTAAAPARKPLRDWALAHGDTLGRLAAGMPARIKNTCLSLPPIRLLLDRFGIARRSPLPRFSAKGFFRRFRAYAQPPGLPRKAVIFPGCFINFYDAECGLDLVFLLNRSGYQAILPKNFVCCGLPLLSNAFLEDARKRATANIAELRRFQDQGVPILAPCTSCSLTIDEDYPEHFPELPPPPPIEDACAFLAACLDSGELSLPSNPNDTARAIIYHAPCHLRAQGRGLPGLELLRMLPGYTVQNAAAGCCGLSGSYGFKKEKYALSLRIGAPLFQTIRGSGAAEAASECGTCRVQIAHGAGLSAAHPVSLLRRCFGTAK